MRSLRYVRSSSAVNCQERFYLSVETKTYLLSGRIIRVCMSFLDDLHSIVVDEIEVVRAVGEDIPEYLHELEVLKDRLLKLFLQ